MLAFAWNSNYRGALIALQPGISMALPVGLSGHKGSSLLKVQQSSKCSDELRLKLYIRLIDMSLEF